MCTFILCTLIEIIACYLFPLTLLLTLSKIYQAWSYRERKHCDIHVFSISTLLAKVPQPSKCGFADTHSSCCEYVFILEHSRRLFAYTFVSQQEVVPQFKYYQTVLVITALMIGLLYGLSKVEPGVKINSASGYSYAFAALSFVFYLSIKASSS